MTAVVFALSVLAALTTFGNRYADSKIYTWDGSSPLSAGFWTSREAAHATGCPHGPCYAVAQRVYPGRTITGVNEYVLYWTDRGLAAMAAALLGSLIFSNRLHPEGRTATYKATITRSLAFNPLRTRTLASHGSRRMIRDERLCLGDALAFRPVFVG